MEKKLDRDFGNRVKELRTEKGLTLEQVGDAIGTSRQYMSNIENGKVPGKNTIRSICDFFNVDMDYLMGRSNTRNILNLDGIYEKGVEHGRRDTLKEISRLAGEGIFATSFSAIPVYSDISCGTGTWVDEIPDDYVGIPTPLISQAGGYFSNRATGDSMMPGIHPGDYLVFEICPEVPSGQIGAFSLNDRFYCKRFKRLPDGSPWLFSDNDAYDPIPIRASDSFRALGIYKIKVSKEQ